MIKLNFSTTINLLKLLTEKEKKEIRSNFLKMTNAKGEIEKVERITLCDIAAKTSVPAFSVKEYLKTLFAKDYLCETVKMFDYDFHQMQPVKNSDGYVLLHSNNKQLYLHTYIVSKLLSLSYEAFKRRKYVTHHIDFDSTRNSLYNLVPMPLELHMSYHNAVRKSKDSIDIYHYIFSTCKDTEYIELLREYIEMRDVFCMSDIRHFKSLINKRESKIS